MDENHLRADSPPVHSLPSELLLDIVLWYQALTRPRPRAWLHLACVCSRWRTVLLGSPTLWTEVDMTMGASYSRAFFRRSQGLPIDVTLGRIRDNPHLVRKVKDVLTELRTHALRVRRLDLMLPWNKKIIETISRMILRMRNLARFVLVITEEQSFTREWPNPFLTGITHPNLREIYFRNVQMSLNTIAVSQLQTLDLTTVRYLEMDDLLDILEVCPGLKHLKLLCIGPLLDEGIVELPNGGRRISLPQLESLIISENVQDLSYLMSHLDLPATLSILLSVTDFHDEDGVPPDTPLAIIEFIPPTITHLEAASRPGYLNIIYDDSDLDIEVSMDIIPSLTSSPCNIRIAMPQHASLLVEAAVSLFQDLPTRFSLTGIRWLGLRGLVLNMFNEAEWLLLLRQLPVLEELEWGHDYQSLLKTLASARTEDEILCPKLRSVLTEGLSLGDRRTMRLLVAFLSRRAAAGYRMAYLSIDEVDESSRVLTEDAVDAIAEEVDEFVCQDEYLPASRADYGINYYVTTDSPGTPEEVGGR